MEKFETAPSTKINPSKAIGPTTGGRGTMMARSPNERYSNMFKL